MRLLIPTPLFPPTPTHTHTYTHTHTHTHTDVLKDDEAPDMPAHKKEPFCSTERTDACLAKFPKMKACVDAVAANEGVQTWLATRGVQKF
jgi:hypothetical protein